MKEGRVKGCYNLIKSSCPTIEIRALTSKYSEFLE
jgi:hypothetical protein